MQLTYMCVYFSTFLNKYLCVSDFLSSPSQWDHYQVQRPCTALFHHNSYERNAFSLRDLKAFQRLLGRSGALAPGSLKPQAQGTYPA